MPVNIVGSAYCPVDQRQVPVATRDQHRTNHILHLLLTVLTLGVWALVWVVVAIANHHSTPSNAACMYCGTPFQFEESRGWQPIQAKPGWYRDAQGQWRWWTGTEWRGPPGTLPPGP